MSTEEFINAIRTNEILWDINHPNFKNAQEKQQIWEEISNKFNLPTIKCKRKWKGLRATLCRQKMRIDKDLPPHKGGGKWKYAENMEFLSPVLKRRSILIGQENKNSSESSGETESETSPLDPIEVKTEYEKIPLPKGDQILLFIDALKERPVLWNCTDPNFKHRELKENAWKEIESILGIPMESCKRKWKGFKNYLTREYTKHPDNNSTWAYYKPLEFVRPYIGHGKWKSFIEENPTSIESAPLEPASVEPTSIEPTPIEPASIEPASIEPASIEPATVVSEIKKEFPEAVIEAVEKHPILWNVHHKNHKSIYKKLKTWEKIALSLDSSVYEVKRKWRGLRDVFSRSYNKNPDANTNSWPYFKLLLFLEPYLKKRLNFTKSFEHTGDSDDEDSLSSAAWGSDNNEHKINKNEEEVKELKNEEFIDVMKEKPILWDTNYDNYKNIKLRFVAWKEIADHFGVTEIGECRKKWKALRDTFTRHYYKPIKEEEKTWKYYKQMSFLVPNLKYKKSLTVFDDSCDETEIKHKPDEQEEQKAFDIKQEIMDDDNLSSAFEDLDRHDLIESKEPFCVDDFIEVVKQHEILWDSNNENNRNNDLRVKEWEDIAAHFSCSVEDCKRKWKALRDSFVRNYFKPIKEKYKNWTYYSQMKFLGPHVKYKKGDSFVGESEFKRRNDTSLSSSFEETKNYENKSSKPKTLRKFTVKEFINEIKKHTILWDLNDERCKLRNYRLKAWKEIAAHFSVSSLECKRKWATLRGAFIREFAKYPNNATWENFEELDFLLPYLKANVTVNRELAATENVFSLGQSTQQNNVISSESNEINSGNQSIFASPDQDWVEDFILAIEKQQILWDTTDCNYKKALKRQQAWNMIAKEFGVSINEAKRKWKSLRETFVVDLNKHGSTEENSSTRWKYYKTMTFLRPHLKMQNTGEMGYEVNYDSDSCGANAVKFQTSATTAEENFTIEFIEAIKAKQLLWNYVDDDYKDEIKKKEAWEQIAMKFNLLITTCKDKWMALQNGYTRVIVGQANDRKYTWKYCEQMDFLRPLIKTRIDSPSFVEVSGCLDFDDIIENYSFPEQAGVSKDDDFDDALYEELFECSPSAIVQNIEQNDVQISDMRERAAAKRRKCSDTSSDDEDKEFYQSLKEKMKKLPSYVKCDAKGHIEAYLKVVAANHNV